MRELVRILGLTPQEIVTLAHSAFAMTSGMTNAANSAAAAVALGVFCADQVTGDGMGLCMAGESSLYLRAGCMPLHGCPECVAARTR